MNSLMIPILLFLLITGLLGSVAYAYLRREQDKLFPQNNYESEFNISKPSSRPSLLSGNCIVLSVAGIILLVILLVNGGWIVPVFLLSLLVPLLGSGDNVYWLIRFLVLIFVALIVAMMSKNRSMVKLSYVFMIVFFVSIMGAVAIYFLSGFLRLAAGD
jgi:hypothetical protein